MILELALAVALSGLIHKPKRKRRKNKKRK